MERAIKLKGVRHHNLKNFDLTIPHETLTVITGVSGSGKTSLAFDTIYAEGQRRYVESLSSYARQFLEMSDKPDVDHIEGLSPSIAIQQRGLNASPRSIVGTTTEIYDYMRLLFARAGTVHCYNCGREVEKTSPTVIVEEILALKNEKIYIMAPLVMGRKGTYEKLFKSLEKEGFLRVVVDGDELRLDDGLPELNKNKKHTISLVVDRLSIKESVDMNRLRSSVETALEKGEGKLLLKMVSSGEERIYSEQFGCPYCNIYYDEIEPRSFSFNSPAGACEDCNGLGFKMIMDKDLILTNPELPVTKGAIPMLQNFTAQMVEQLLDHHDIDKKTPFEKLPQKIQDEVLYGSKDVINFSVKTRNMAHDFDRHFEGVITMLERRYRETSSEEIRQEMSRYLAKGVCESCGGRRLQPKALAVKVGGLNIFEMGEIQIEYLYKLFLDNEKLGLDDFKLKIAEKLVKEIKLRLSFLYRVGLGYLTLNRQTGTLSGGESQRIHLATQIGSALTGVTYVLDEPSIGLHSSDTVKLIDILQNLRDQGNNVIVVEHDREIIEAADFLVDLGPGAGEKGGELIFADKSEKILENEKSLTGAYLSGRKAIPLPAKRMKPAGHIHLKQVTTNNLKNVDAQIPLGIFTAVTGVSGSGKSSLIMETLIPALKKKKAAYKKVEIKGQIGDVIEIDQSPIGQTPRSNPATYTGAFGPIRELFSSLPESRARGYKPGRFSFNVKGGRCENCQGAGIIRIEMNFMPDTYITCPVCGGKRFNRDTLEIRYKGHSIYDILEMEVDQAIELFAPFPAIKRKLSLLDSIGLGYIKLGQPAHTLSGGEAQRIKLSKELSKKRSADSVYILDEPTTGLHFDDIRKLIDILQKLVERGSTVIVIEHNMDIVKCADHIIDIGPHGGDKGGTIVASGTPEKVAENENSLTAPFLRDCLQ